MSVFNSYNWIRRMTLDYLCNYFVLSFDCLQAQAWQQFKMPLNQHKHMHTVGLRKHHTQLLLFFGIISHSSFFVSPKKLKKNVHSSFAIDLNLPSIIVEGNLEVVIIALRSEEESLSCFGYLISLTTQSLDVFHSIIFSCTRRSRNSITYNLAKYARHVSNFFVWMKDIIPHLHYVLLTD